MMNIGLICPGCNKEIPPNHVQQGGYHLGCYENYMNQDVKVWRVSLDGSSYLHEESSIDLTLLRDGETARVATVKRKELLIMKEFTGF